ncbi:MAG: HAMP domain-containing protein [Pseudanabaena sp.]
MYIVHTHKLPHDLQLAWSVGVIAPKSIFMKEIDDNNRFTLFIIAIMLGINIVIGLVIASWLLRPIKNLMTAAKGIEEESFNPDELTEIAARKDELGQMARVFQEMGNTIYVRQQGMKSQLHKLRQEKDEAKKAAIASQKGQSNSLQLILNRARSVRNK